MPGRSRISDVRMAPDRDAHSIGAMMGARVPRPHWSYAEACGLACVRARLSPLRWARGATCGPGGAAGVGVIEPSARDLVTAHGKQPLDVRLEQRLSIRT